MLASFLTFLRGLLWGSLCLYGVHLRVLLDILVWGYLGFFGEVEKVVLVECVFTHICGGGLGVKGKWGLECLVVGAHSG